MNGMFVSCCLRRKLCGWMLSCLQCLPCVCPTLLRMCVVCFIVARIRTAHLFRSNAHSMSIPVLYGGIHVISLSSGLFPKHLAAVVSKVSMCTCFGGFPCRVEYPSGTHEATVIALKDISVRICRASHACPHPHTSLPRVHYCLHRILFGHSHTHTRARTTAWGGAAHLVHRRGCAVRGAKVELEVCSHLICPRVPLAVYL